MSDREGDRHGIGSAIVAVLRGDAESAGKILSALPASRPQGIPQPDSSMWVRPKESLPEDGQIVLAVGSFKLKGSDGRISEVFTARYLATKSRKVGRFCPLYGTRRHSVCLWMPIPPLPHGVL